MSRRLPTIFVSHGAPTLPLTAAPAREFLAGYGAALGRPSAILVVSAHWETATPTLDASTHPQTIHDFSGFPRALYEMRYPVPGDPALARRAASLLGAAGMPAVLGERGLDHGAWVPLLLMYPAADIPVVQLSLQTQRGAAYQLRVGEALRPLREDGVLVMGSGSATHNLGEFRGSSIDAPPPDWVTGFADWLDASIEAGRTDDLVDYRRKAPAAARNHPSEEHLLPLFTALGAAGDGATGRRVHRSTTFGVLAMDVYEWA
jgi:4,5-DOPA dioxygenase extradiol